MTSRCTPPHTLRSQSGEGGGTRIARAAGNERHLPAGVLVRILRKLGKKAAQLRVRITPCNHLGFPSHSLLSCLSIAFAHSDRLPQTFPILSDLRFQWTGERRKAKIWANAPWGDKLGDDAREASPAAGRSQLERKPKGSKGRYYPEATRKRRSTPDRAPTQAPAWCHSIFYRYS